eukprot:Skav229608  [mRNA]  locus=scaffold510:250291:254575:+ [translate_table: standard]
MAPKQEAMATTASLKAQPKVPGNGCCGCGGATPAIDVEKIAAAGGKYAQARIGRAIADDGRIIEYYTYGSEKSDADVLLQIKGKHNVGKQGQDDKQSPPEHGKFLRDLYMQKAAKCIPNIGKGGHGAHHVAFGRGELLRLMLSVLRWMQPPKLPAAAKKILATVREQYASPCAPGA